MASGLPDYYRGVDVAYQALTQVIVRPRFGGGRNLSGQKEVTGKAQTLLCDVSGKGMIYGGTVWLDAALTQANSIVVLVTDMQSLSYMSFLRLNEYGVTDPGKAVVTINKYDGDNYIYSVGLSYGITFEGGFTVLYNEEYDRRPTVHYDITYALI